MPRLEKDVKSSVLSVLDNLQRAGAVVWHLRINSGKVQTKYGSWIQMAPLGTPDIMAVLSNGKIYFIETKSDTGKQSLPQKQFQENCKDWATYEIVTSSDQVYKTVERLTGHYEKILDGITLD